MGKTLTKEELNKKADKEFEILYNKAMEGKINECLRDLPCLKAMEKAVSDYLFQKNKRELGIEK